ncbi:NAD(P)-binding protein [Microthyrium microscopicum]|uniref:NAD(P)-binding protein n=1 Tax=Microthyrium microscopicum TaxID=703497 RepID=A0A6A6TVH7_9PEZI|nr:NAD(P)-binding protein [Microthyrium microscopicum]
MEAALKTFFSSSRFAVVGASSDTAKFGHKVFVWYLQHNLPVTPINPRVPEVSVKSSNYVTVASPNNLSSPGDTSLSIITPPAATMKVLQEAKDAGVPAVWLQPGSYNDEVMAFARKEFDAAIGGTEGGTSGDEGWCVLVDGEDGLKLAGREWSKL